MKILVTGAKGFVGKNLCQALLNLKQGKNQTRPQLTIEQVYEYDIDNSVADLEEFCSKSDFVFNLAGVNRPKDDSEFMNGNLGFASTLLETLERLGNKCPVMLSSSIQATLFGRYDGEYGRSKKAGEELFFDYQERTGAKVYVYRFPNLFGKWCKPNYNSAVATFCYNSANGLDIKVNDRNTNLELLYVDDLVEEMLNLLEGKATSCNFEGVETVINEKGRYYTAQPTHKVTLGEIEDLLIEFRAQRQNLIIPSIKAGSFAKKLYSTYLSYLPADKMVLDLNMNIDERGSFTELVKTLECGQFSVNVSKPGVKKGEHYHDTKWEMFIVVSGQALIEQRKIGTDEVIKFKISGDKIQAVYMLPGYTHNIINLSESENLVTLMYANELFDKNKPDTFYEKVEK